jgi:N-methylhydantoinase A/oxoprolinase/acetone carboxylase beta subunit
MTTATKPDRQPPPHLVAAQHKHSRDKRLRVRAALQTMIDEGATITFAEVARRAGVSRSLVYTQGIREDIEIGRAQPARPNHRPPAAPVPRTEVLLLKKRNDKLRSEVADLRQALREKLGAEVEFGDAVSLRREIDELQHDNDTLRSQISELNTQLDAERAQRIEAEDALSASRELVKKMIRDDNAT